jgi:hypothetical protein
MDILTPLLCSLLDILGVSREAVLQAARVAKTEELATQRAIWCWIDAAM